MIKNLRRQEGGVRAWEHHSGHLSVVAFLGLGMWSWADAEGFTAAVVEHWLLCCTCPDREMWNMVLKLQMESLAITGLNHARLTCCIYGGSLSEPSCENAVQNSFQI